MKLAQCLVQHETKRYQLQESPNPSSQAPAFLKQKGVRGEIILIPVSPPRTLTEARHIYNNNHI